ncbi:ABC transporter permease [Oceanicella sp. SM1341]|uniref:ABC transporter permease n=1 Tax=Oceanicella sp. SM1341 TaxID=1548889 RepID=UPI000E4B536F|nr:ABC transporter permease [Oceanicella sp. SM1341]
MMDPDAHYVAPGGHDPDAERQVIERQDLDAATWMLVWRRFLRHKLAVLSGLFLLVTYLALPFVDFLAPYDPAVRDDDHLLAPPQPMGLFDGGLLVSYPSTESLDLTTLQRVYEPDYDNPQPVRWFASCGPQYSFLGLWMSDNRLACPPEGGTLYILGTDRLGRDLLSRLMHGARLSLTVGLIGVAISFAIGMIVGGVAGYFGGWVDSVVQRVIEIIRSLPELPIWLALSAAVPASWGPVSVFFVISIILGLLDWPGLARAVRSKFLSLREEEYVRAAELMGASTTRVIGAHMMPNFMSHLVATATLSIPTMILGETALSFLGLGLRPPAVSWGLMLNDALQMGQGALTVAPWVLWPLVPVMLVVLAYNFVGDGIRDALDPYS